MGHSSVSLTFERARNIALSSQLLKDSFSGGSAKDAVAGIIDHLGYVQIDTISVVKRAHHHTIWTRSRDYDPALLQQLQAKDRKVFEYWGHAASYLPMSDYRFYTPMMRRHRDPKDKWARSRFQKYGHLLEGVLERIRKEGPLGARDFKSSGGRSGSQWWDWKPSKTALELLFWRGDLMITRRDGFQRIYDLTERVLPAGTDTTMPNPDQLGRFLVRRALRAHGLARPATIVDYIHAADRGTIISALKVLRESGEVLEADIEGESGYYVLSSALEMSQGDGAIEDRVRILSPFDNLIINRNRIEKLFGFSYSLECYTPKEKRRYGYFVLPVIRGNSFVARLDAKADRKQGVLRIRSLFMERGQDLRDGSLHLLFAELRDFAEFNGCRTMTVEQVTPRKYLRAVKRGVE